MNLCSAYFFISALVRSAVGSRPCPALASYFTCKVSSSESYRCDACLGELEPQESGSNGASVVANLTGSSIPDSTIYLIIMAPPDWGSSALENLIASSPAVSTMCNKTYWQCESTHVLVQYGLLDWETRKDPAKTDWDQIYAFFEDFEIWDDMSKPIRIVKSPYNVLKSKSLLNYFLKTKKDYRFLVLERDVPCLSSALDRRSVEYSAMRAGLDEIYSLTPHEKRLTIHYEDMVTRPYYLMHKILDWFPQLRLLHGDEKHIRGSRMNYLKKNTREEPLLEYIHSSSCVIKRPRIYSPAIVHRFKWEDRSWRPPVQYRSWRNASISKGGVLAANAG